MWFRIWGTFTIWLQCDINIDINLMKIGNSERFKYLISLIEYVIFFITSAFTCGRIEASYRDTTTDMCLEPVLADTTRTMCEQ